jgi:hypothetical protein
MAETAESKLRADGGGERLDETASLDGRMKGKPARYAFAGAGRIIHHILWQHHKIRRRPSPTGQWLDYLPTAVIDSLSNREMLHVIREHAITKRRDECAATIDEMIDYFYIAFNFG